VEVIDENGEPALDSQAAIDAAQALLDVAPYALPTPQETAFDQALRIDPWAALLPLDGEDAAPVVGEAVDLTPQMREDSLLALPQHPVCSPECRGVPLENMASSASGGVSSDAIETQSASSAWSALDALKLD